MTTRQALWTLIGVSTLLRVVLASCLGGYTNEAYYFLYARSLSWCYFDHPPMVAAVAALGLNLTPGLPTLLSLRLGFIAMFAGSTWLLARMTERFFGARAGVLAALAMNATLFFGLLVGTCAEPDGPLLFFWLLTLDRLSVAVENPRRTLSWAMVGVAWGWAMLSKYHAVLLPAGAALYLLVKPTARRCLRHPGPYVALATGLVVFSPVVWWNVTHEWASFAFQGGRAGGFQGFRLDSLAETILAESLLLTPWIWIGLIVILARLLWRGPRHWSDAEAFLLCQSIPAIFLFLGVATFRRILPHWPLIGFVALIPLLGRVWSRRWEADARRQLRRLTALTLVPVGLAVVMVAQSRLGLLSDHQGQLLGLLSPEDDPSVDMIRWDQIAANLQKLGLVDQPGTFLFTDYWRFSAQLDMAVQGHTPVACFQRDGRSFRFWSRREDWVARDGIYVHVPDSMGTPATFAPWFRDVKPIAKVPIVRRGVALQTVVLYRCRHLLRAYPTGINTPEPSPAQPGISQNPKPDPGPTHRGARASDRSPRPACKARSGRGQRARKSGGDRSRFADRKIAILLDGIDEPGKPRKQVTRPVQARSTPLLEISRINMRT